MRVELLDLLPSEFNRVVHGREDRIQDLGDAVACVGGRVDGVAATASLSTLRRGPWMAEHGRGSPRPSGQKSATISGSRSGDSHLFTARTVSRSDGHFRRNAVMSSSVRTCVEITQ